MPLGEELVAVSAELSDSLLQRSERFMSLDPFVFYLTHYALAAINQFYGFVNQTALMVSHVSISGAIMHGMAFIMWLFALSWRKLFYIHCYIKVFFLIPVTMILMGRGGALAVWILNMVQAILQLRLVSHLHVETVVNTCDANYSWHLISFFTILLNGNYMHVSSPVPTYSFAQFPMWSLGFA